MVGETDGEVVGTDTVGPWVGLNVGLVVGAVVGETDGEVVGADTVGP